DKPQDQAQSEVIYDPNIPVQQPKSAEKHQLRQSSRWGVTVIRGRESKIEEFETSENDPNWTAPKK
ncbi:MAG: hypothetical protein WBC05_12200, partial [Sedimentisphaerales bacterium]